uniref:Uncharacterized protein n=1 Tax=Timema douglasi TaxID=61478 RepID=A0A7R8Z9K1_TIMDO|nr:unnamed protein product [Timema douglasi]
MNAALTALRALSEMGLDSVSPSGGGHKDPVNQVDGKNAKRETKKEMGGVDNIKRWNLLGPLQTYHTPGMMAGLHLADVSFLGVSTRLRVHQMYCDQGQNPVDCRRGRPPGVKFAIEDFSSFAYIMQLPRHLVYYFILDWFPVLVALSGYCFICPFQMSQSTVQFLQSSVHGTLAFEQEHCVRHSEQLHLTNSLQAAQIEGREDQTGTHSPAALVHPHPSGPGTLSITEQARLQTCSAWYAERRQCCLNASLVGGKLDRLRLFERATEAILSQMELTSSSFTPIDALRQLFRLGIGPDSSGFVITSAAVSRIEKSLEF